jgi:hypothetical protein
MNRQEAKELLPIIQAFTEGKTIQYFCESKNPHWIDIKSNENVDFNDNISNYRIKPEPKYRPFANKEECWQEMQKHQPLEWIKDTSTICNIINIQKTGVFIYDGIANRYLNFINVFNLKFADGTPFGIKE